MFYVIGKKGSNVFISLGIRDRCTIRNEAIFEIKIAYIYIVFYKKS